MTGDALTFAPAWKLAEDVRSKKVSPVELVDHFLKRIDRLNPTLQAFITVAGEHARAAARRAETEVMQKKQLPPLHGVPLAVKDTLFSKGLRTTGASLIYEDFVPDHDAIVVERLTRAGAIVVGKTSTPEFAMGAGLSYNLVTDDDCHNPWDVERSASASSGGSAVAVAAGLAPMAVGSDAGGSIRLPAAWCGVYGLKPTKGRVPASGDFESMPLFGVVGPLTRTVRDAAVMLQAMSGYDRRDVFAMREGSVDCLEIIETPLPRLRMAWSPDLGYPQVDPELRAVAQSAAFALEDLGCHVEMASPDVGRLREVWLPIAEADLYAGHQEVLRRYPHRLTPVLKTILEEGGRVTGAQYATALWATYRIRAEMTQFFDTYDLLLTPSTPIGPPKIREILSDYRWPGESLGGVLTFTPLANITGGPSASVPCGFTSGGLPVGLLMTGRWGEDATVLHASAAFERLQPWADKIPPAARI